MLRSAGPIFYHRSRFRLTLTVLIEFSKLRQVIIARKRRDRPLLPVPSPSPQAENR
jgi:hypothetical protein